MIPLFLVCQVLACGKRCGKLCGNRVGKYLLGFKSVTFIPPLFWVSKVLHP